MNAILHSFTDVSVSGNFYLQQFSVNFRTWLSNFKTNRKTPNITDKRIVKALTYIEQHFQDGVQLTDAAMYVGLAEESLSRLFSKLNSITFSEMVNEVRVAYAIKQLLTTDELITGIAYDSGFGSTRNFTRAFRQITGLTPVDFRRICAMRIFNVQEPGLSVSWITEKNLQQQAGGEIHHFRLLARGL
ncbi:MAG: AraC family transcriptional regulator [Paludibacter sp.]|nr:AraC family transcriptional regulator [Paludibacter sp.]